MIIVRLKCRINSWWCRWCQILLPGDFIWSLGMICTLVYYTASSTGRDDCEYATRQTIGHWKALHAHVLSIFLQNKRFRVWKITHPPHPGRLLQYTIPTGMLRALAELKCRAIEHSTASNRGRGVHVLVSTNQCRFQVSRYLWIEEDHTTEEQKRN